jgi:pimeloyl-ACP methyl ester carboxylesterase
MESTPGHRVNLEKVVDAPPLVMRYAPGTGDELVLAFSGVGHAPSPSVEPEIEFYRIARGNGARHALFITDQSRSWLNAPGMAEQIAAGVRGVMARAGLGRLTALGNSMGGTMALLMARFLPIQSTLAIVPQYSVDLGLMPQEPNYMRMRRRIATFRFPAVDALPKTGKFFVLHGTQKSELAHATRFPMADNLHHFIFPGQDHNLSANLKAMGHAEPLVNAALAGSVAEFTQTVTAIGAVARQDFTGVCA